MARRTTASALWPDSSPSSPYDSAETSVAWAAATSAKATP